MKSTDEIVQELKSLLEHHERETVRLRQMIAAAEGQPMAVPVVPIPAPAPLPLPFIMGCRRLMGFDGPCWCVACMTLSPMFACRKPGICFCPACYPALMPSIIVNPSPVLPTPVLPSPMLPTPVHPRYGDHGITYTNPMPSVSFGTMH